MRIVISGKWFMIFRRVLPSRHVRLFEGTTEKNPSTHSPADLLPEFSWIISRSGSRRRKKTPPIAQENLVVFHQRNSGNREWILSRRRKTPTINDWPVVQIIENDGNYNTFASEFCLIEKYKYLSSTRFTKIKLIAWVLFNFLYQEHFDWLAPSMAFIGRKVHAHSRICAFIRGNKPVYLP